MTSDLALLLVLGFALALGLGFGIVRTLQMEDDEYPKDREKNLEAFAAANGFTWSRDQNLLAQSRLPALRLVAEGAGTPYHVMTREDETFETMVFDLGYPREGLSVNVGANPRRSALGMDWGFDHTSDDSGVSIQLTEGSVVLLRTAFAFRLPRRTLPEISINARHQHDLGKIPTTLQPAFASGKSWCLETSEDWIFFHRPLVRAQSTKELAIGDALIAAEELRDALLAHWHVLPARHSA